MYTKLRKCHLLASVLVVLSSPAIYLNAATLDLAPSSVGGSITHNYFPFPPSLGSDDQAFTFGTPFMQLADYDMIQVKVSAPAGQAWHVSYTGQGLSSASLLFYLRYVPPGQPYSAPWAPIISSSLQFDFVDGSVASLGSFSATPYAVPENPGDRFDLDVSYAVVGDFTFTGFTATLKFDNGSLAHSDLSSFLDSRLNYGYSPSAFGAPDPGALMTLQAVPEPSTTTMVNIGSLAVLMLRFRHRCGFFGRA